MIKTRNLYAVFIALLGTAFLFGQEVTPETVRDLVRKLKENEKKFERYEQQMNNLKKEVKILKDRLRDVEQDDKVDELRREVEDMLEETESEVVEENSRGLLNKYIGTHIINISGYYNFIYLQDSKENSPGSFRAHELTFFFQKRIYDFNLFAEVAFEFAPVFEGEGDLVSGSGEIFIEQSWLEYLYAPYLNVRVGLMLTPETWNLQHYPTTTYTAARPLHLNKIFPRDYVGIAFYGNTCNYLGEDFGFSYIFYLSNGPGPNKGKEDANENKVVAGKLMGHLPKLDFFEQFDIGGNLYYGKNEAKDYDFLWNVELLVEAHGVTLHAEYAHGRRKFHDHSLEKRKNYGGFVELAYTFWDKYSLISRAEIYDPDRRGVDRIKKLIFGARYKPLPEISIKGEFFQQWHNDRQEEDFNGISLSIAALL